MITHFGMQILDYGWKGARAAHPQSAIRNPRFRRGFTLLELIAAMSLMVVVSSCLYTALYTGFRAYRTAQAVADPSVVALNVIELLKRDIRGVLPPGGTLAGAFIGTDSGGVKGVDADSLEFHTTNLHVDDTLTLGQTTEPLLVGGIAKVTLLLEEDDETKDGTYLLLRQVTTDLLAPQEIEPEEQVLCRGVVSLNFCYFDGSSWLDEWDSTADANSLPQAIEIDLEVAHKDKRTREIQGRRLVQSFAIPCEAAAATEESTTTGSTSSGTNTNTQSGASAGGSTAGGAAAGGTAR
ncbi:MAG: prepilin-type N-terminal cleavage/methylation domain-containing protein [Planctomycetes bacterium]|jgi:prepilin-type N-terminal cleavage/methylation domain-containing protein|nr:prepilin-type N-terminal cleavage/methylation domain-containing protein [Planctomycetota bacterium]